MGKTVSKKWIPILIEVVALFAITIPVTRLFCNTYLMSVINSSLIYFIVVAGMTVMAGYGGMISMCSISFMGLSGFICTQLTKTYGMPSWFGIIAGTIGGTLFAVFVGALLLKLEGAYFIFGTLAIVYITFTIFNNYAPLTGANQGIAKVPDLNLFGIVFDDYYSWYVLLLIVAIAVIWLALRIKKTYLGRALMAVKGDKVAATTLGINVYRTKIIGFAVGSSFAALAGALYPLHYNAISYAAFSANVELKIVIMAMLGGVQSVFGAIIGTFIVNALPELLRFMQGYINLLYGVILVLLMVFMPEGLAGLGNKLFSKARKRDRNAGEEKN